MEPRQERGLALSKSARIKPVVGNKWVVPSASGPNYYIVDAGEQTCSCPDFGERRLRCKHLWALSYARSETREPDGTVTVTEIVKVTYAQDWPAYNAAQMHERDHVEALLRDLCSGLVTPPHPGRGPKPIPLADLVFGMTMKVYTGFSARRASSDIRGCATEGKVTRAPHYNSILAGFDRDDLTSVLTKMIEDSAAPLATVEEKFALRHDGLLGLDFLQHFSFSYDGPAREFRLSWSW